MQKFWKYYRRMKLQEASITAEKYFARLKERKAKLIEEILKFDVPKKPLITNPHPPGFTAVPANLRNLYEARPKIYSKRVLTGYVEPSWWGKADITGSYVNDDSTYRFGYADDYFLQNGCVVVAQELNAKGGDCLEHYVAGFQINWDLPKTISAGRISFSLDVQHHFDFTNGADDGARFQSFVIMIISNEDGIFPSSLEIYDPETTLIDVKSSGSGYDSGVICLEKTFITKKDAYFRVALCHFLRLWAQDGLVEVVGTIMTHNPDTYLGAPSLKHELSPM